MFIASILVSVQRVLNNASVPICEGALLSNHQFVTAAHCSDGNIAMAELVARVGSKLHDKGGKLHGFSHIDIHPQYTHEGTDIKDDIAIVTLLDPIQQPTPWIHLARPGALPDIASVVDIFGWDLLPIPKASNVSIKGTRSRQHMKTVARSPSTCKVLGRSFDASPQMCSSFDRGPDEEHWTGGPAVQYDIETGEPRIVGVVSYWNTFDEESFVFATRIAPYLDWVAQAREARYMRPHSSLPKGRGEGCTKVVGFDWRGREIVEPC